MNFLLILSVPFICTMIGASTVFFFNNKISHGMTSSFLSLAAGIMVSSSIFSLLLPAFDAAEVSSVYPAIIVSISFILGGVFLYSIDFLDRILNRKMINKEDAEKKKSLLIFAMILHNIPEGMAVGLMCGVALQTNSLALINASLALAIGIGIQNIPEGAAIALPLRAKGMSKGKSFCYGALSGVIEPISACLAIMFVNYIQGAMPFLLAFSAGCMIYVVLEELVPKAKLGSNAKYASLVFLIGFTIMMFLDTTLG